MTPLKPTAGLTKAADHLVGADHNNYSDAVQDELEIAKSHTIPRLLFVVSHKKGNREDRLTNWLEQTYANPNSPTIKHTESPDHLVQSVLRSTTNTFSEKGAEEDTNEIGDAPFLKFIGRESELQNITKQVLSRKGDDYSVLLGMGGIGKSALAFQVGREVIRNEHAARLVWVDCSQTRFSDQSIHQDSPKKLRDMLLGEFFQLISRPLLSRSDAAVQTEWFENSGSNGKTNYVVFDNFETVEYASEVAQKLSKMIAKSAHLVFTSRHAIQQPDACSISVPPFGESDSISFLRMLGNERGIDRILSADDEALMRIHTAAQGLPLALHWLAGQLNFHSLEGLLREFGARLQQSETGELYRRIFDRSWNEASTQSQRVLLALATTPLYAGATISELKIVTELDVHLLESSLAELLRLSLVNLSGALGNEEFSIHEVTKNFIDLRTR